MSNDNILSYLSGHPFEHTPIDDLESFLWVLLWLTLAIPENVGTLSQAEQSVIDHLRLPHISSHRGRDNHVQTLRKDIFLRQSTRAIEVLFPLIDAWFAICQKARAEVANLQQEHSPHLSQINQQKYLMAVDPLTMQYFGEFILTAHEMLPDLPRSWDGLFVHPTITQ